MRHARSAAIGVVLAAFGGVAWGLSFSARPSSILPWVALVPTLLLFELRRPTPWIFAAGWTSWVVGLWWIVDTVRTYGGLPWLVGVAGLALLASILSLQWVLFGLLGRPLWRRGGVAAWLGLPALWVGGEVFRGAFLTGFPWNLAAYAVTEVPGALAVSAWVGAFGVSALVVGVNVAAARSARDRRWAPAGAVALGVVIALCLAGRWAPVGGADGGGPALPVRLVQPDIANLTEWDSDVMEESYRRLLRLSREACDEPALLIWPESAAWPREWQVDRRLQRDLVKLGAMGCAVLLNTPWREGNRITNAALLVDGDRVVGRYDKRHLVPFGEYVPGWLPVPGTLARNVGSFDRGDEATLVEWGGQRLGIAVCYEVVFAGEVSDLVAAGATALVTVTNDAWYGDTAAPWQHFRAARFRAAESGRPLLRAAITGVSGWIGADGSVSGQLGVGETGILQGELEASGFTTPYSRTEWLVPLLSVLWTLTLVGSWLGDIWRRRSSRRGS